MTTDSPVAKSVEFVGINGHGSVWPESERAPEGMEMVEPLPSTAEADWLETESDRSYRRLEAVPRRSRVASSSVLLEVMAETTGASLAPVMVMVAVLEVPGAVSDVVGVRDDDIHRRRGN